ncbi:MAG: SPOR domain-containing protein [bacterium]|nr:SPOR domain-containing protein [bacterium]
MSKKKQDSSQKRLVKILEVKPVFTDVSGTEVSDFLVLLFNTSGSTEVCTLKLTIRDENEDEILFHTEQVELSPNSESENKINLEIPLINQIAFEVRTEIFKETELLHSTNWTPVFDTISTEEEVTVTQEIELQDSSESLKEKIKNEPEDEKDTSEFDEETPSSFAKEEVTEKIVIKPEVKKQDALPISEENTEQIQLPSKEEKQKDKEPSPENKPVQDDFQEEDTQTEIKIITSEPKPAQEFEKEVPEEEITEPAIQIKEEINSPQEIPEKEEEKPQKKSSDDYDIKSFKSSWGLVIEEDEAQVFEEVKTPESEKEEKVIIEDKNKVLSNNFIKKEPLPEPPAVEEKAKEPELKKPVKANKLPVFDEIVEEVPMKNEKQIEKKEEIIPKPQPVKHSSPKDEITIEKLKEELLKEEEESFSNYGLDADDFSESEEELQPVLAGEEKYKSKEEDSYNIYKPKPAGSAETLGPKSASKKRVRNFIILFMSLSIIALFIFVTNPFDTQGNYIVIDNPTPTPKPEPNPEPVPQPKPNPENPKPGNINIDITEDINELLDSQVVDSTFWVIEVAAFTEKNEADSELEKIKKMGYKPEIEKIGNKFAVMIKHVKEKDADKIIEKLKSAGYTASKEPEIEF